MRWKEIAAGLSACQLNDWAERTWDINVGERKGCERRSRSEGNERGSQPRVAWSRFARPYIGPFIAFFLVRYPCRDVIPVWEYPSQPTPIRPQLWHLVLVV